MSNTTIQVSFSTPGADAYSNAHLSAEIDSREGGLNAGKTSFAPGDDVYILVYKSSNVEISSVAVSAGSCSGQGSVNVSTTEDVIFADSVESSLGKPCAGGLTSQKWLGNNLGAISLGSDQTTLTIAAKGVGVAKVGFDSTALVYKLTSPTTLDGETDFTILVMVVGDVV